MKPLTKLRLYCFGVAASAGLLAKAPANADPIPGVPIPLVTAADELYGSSVRVAPGDAKVFFLAQEEEPFFHTSTRLYEVPIGGGPVTTRTNEANAFTERVFSYGFSPNGMDLVIKEQIRCGACISGDVFSMPISAGPPKQLTFDDGIVGGLGWRPEFSKDGSRLVFLDDGFNRPQELFSVPLDGSALATRLNQPIPYWYDEVRTDWKFLPGGEEILYVAPQAEEIGYNLYKVGASGGTPQRLNISDGIHFWTSGTNSFAVDAVGSRVAYGVDEGPAGRTTVMSRQIAGGPEVQLTPGLAQHDDVRLTMHGFAQDQVIFEADFNNAYRYDLYAAAFDGGPARNITAPYSYLADSAFISPNGDAVIFTTYANAVWPPYPDTEREVLFYDVAADSVRSLGVYPSSSELPFFIFNAAGDHFVMQGGGVPTQLFTSKGEFVRSLDDGFGFFHPDGQHFLRLGSLPGAPPYHPELFMERLDGEGDAVHISNDESGVSGVREFAFSSDGMTLIYARSDFGQPIEIFAVPFVPEPGALMIAAAAGLSLSGLRRRSSSAATIFQVRNAGRR